MALTGQIYVAHSHTPHGRLCFIEGERGKGVHCLELKTFADILINLLPLLLPVSMTIL